MECVQKVLSHMFLYFCRRSNTACYVPAFKGAVFKAAKPSRYFYIWEVSVRSANISRATRQVCLTDTCTCALSQICGVPGGGSRTVFLPGRQKHKTYMKGLHLIGGGSVRFFCQPECGWTVREKEREERSEGEEQNERGWLPI
jgi:hypothetical protein